MQTGIGLRERGISHHVDFDDRTGDIADAQTEDDIGIGREGGGKRTIHGDRTVCPYRLWCKATAISAACGNSGGAYERNEEDGFELQPRCPAKRFVNVIIGTARGCRRGMLVEARLLLVEDRNAGLLALPAGDQMVAGARHGESG